MLLAVLLVAMLLISVAGGFQYAHMLQVIHDQQEYIELGCNGRYQGAE